MEGMIDMDDDVKDDGSGFLIRRSKRQRRDGGDSDISMLSVDNSFDRLADGKEERILQ